MSCFPPISRRLPRPQSWSGRIPVATPQRGKARNPAIVRCRTLHDEGAGALASERSACDASPFVERRVKERSIDRRAGAQQHRRWGRSPLPRQRLHARSKAHCDTREHALRAAYVHGGRPRERRGRRREFAPRRGRLRAACNNACGPCACAAARGNGARARQLAPASPCGETVTRRRKCGASVVAIAFEVRRVRSSRGTPFDVARAQNDLRNFFTLSKCRHPDSGCLWVVGG